MAIEDRRRETWALCPECVRWFYCPCQFGEPRSRARCPVCAAEPETVQTLPGGG